MSWTSGTGGESKSSTTSARYNIPYRFGKPTTVVVAGGLAERLGNAGAIDQGVDLYQEPKRQMMPAFRRNNIDRLT
jgi:hypothetical protein